MTETKNERPELKGVAQTKSGDEYSKVGKIALWRNGKHGKKSPKYRGNVTINGTKYFLSVWDNTEKGDAD